MTRVTMQKTLPLVVRANGKMVAAFTNRSDAEIWALKHSEAFLSTTYEIEDLNRPKLRATRITKGGFDDFPGMAGRV